MELSSKGQLNDNQLYFVDDEGVIDVGGDALGNLPEPVLSSDAATKNYVDSEISKIDVSDQLTAYAMKNNISVSYNATTKKIILNADGHTTDIDATAFIKDGMINTAAYDHTSKKIVLTFNTDSGKSPISVDVAALVDTYTAGNGLSINGNQFSIDESVVATKTFISNNYQPKGSYLTSHQSLTNYYTKSETNDLSSTIREGLATSDELSGYEKSIESIQKTMIQVVINGKKSILIESDSNSQTWVGHGTYGDMTVWRGNNNDGDDGYWFNIQYPTGYNDELWSLELPFSSVIPENENLSESLTVDVGEVENAINLPFSSEQLTDVLHKSESAEYFKSKRDINDFQVYLPEFLPKSLQEQGQLLEKEHPNFGIQYFRAWHYQGYVLDFPWNEKTKRWENPIQSANSFLTPLTGEGVYVDILFVDYTFDPDAGMSFKLYVRAQVGNGAFVDQILAEIPFTGEIGQDHQTDLPMGLGTIYASYGNMNIEKFEVNPVDAEEEANGYVSRLVLEWNSKLEFWTMRPNANYFDQDDFSDGDIIIRGSYDYDTLQPIFKIIMLDASNHNYDEGDYDFDEQVIIELNDYEYHNLDFGMGPLDIIAKFKHILTTDDLNRVVDKTMDYNGQFTAVDLAEWPNHNDQMPPSYSMTQGYATTTTGEYSHAEGYSSHAEGYYSHAEGYGTYAKGTSSHAEGSNSHADGDGSHAEGSNSYAKGSYSHAEGNYSHAEGYYSHAEGYNTYAKDYYSHAEGTCTYAEGYASHAEGYAARTNTSDRYSFAWNGDANKSSYTTYNSHGQGTFNINPENGLSGFYIGEQNLAGILSSYQTSSDDCVVKTAQTLTDAEKKQVGINTGFRYQLLTVTPVLQSGTTYTCTVEDFAINTIPISSSTNTYKVLLPQALDDRARDFVIRFEVACADNPNIMFVPPGTEDVDYESDNDNWATVVPGVNMMTFTEIKRV